MPAGVAMVSHAVWFFCVRKGKARHLGAAPLSRVAACCAMILLWMLSGTFVFAKGEGSGEKVPVFFEELFLGEIVHPQDKGEIQFTTGFMQAVEKKQEYALPVIVEYGITDYFQVAVGVPVQFKRSGDPADGVGNIEFDGYWNFHNNPDTGLALGTGFAVGLPTATPDVGKDAVIYEPYFIAYRHFDKTGVNFSLGLEVKDYTDREEETELEGFITMATFRQHENFVTLLELGIQIEEDETMVRLAPGLYWQPSWTKAEFGVSLPIGLTTDTPDFGVWMLATVEFEPKDRHGSDDDGDDDD